MDTHTTPSRLHPAARALIGAVVAAAAGWGTLVGWFVGVVSWSGCFISCGDPNQVLGLGAMGLAVVLFGTLVAAVGYAFVGWRRSLMVRLWLIAGGVGAILGAASLVAS
ncbi:MAG TPA: hypothetical protein VLB67_05705 [Acidimicrobiia bacterium]|nr:hypothetical protein [Acidimicrobiia bacterium]